MHQGFNCRTPDSSSLYFPTKLADSKLPSKEILGGQCHAYPKIYYVLVKSHKLL